MRKPTLDVEQLVNPDILATEIANRFQEWNTYRKDWLEQKKELRNYLYATDTRTTSNRSLPWMNSTTTPKLTQIYDNLKANYTAALFPNSNWMKWEAGGPDGLDRNVSKTILYYMKNKLRQSGFEIVVDKLVDDFILYGNAFAAVSFESDYTEVGKEVILKYLGPKLNRVSPNDIVFDPTAASFKDTPKIIRSLIGLGELKREADNGNQLKAKAFEKMIKARQEINGGSATEKSDGFVADGFSSIEHYYGSNYVELLTFYGDIYDTDTSTLKEKRMITVADRAYVIDDQPIPSWLGEDYIFHIGWRNRPDNLYAMGPLDNLVGMQYRIDHLENLKADVFDQIAFPVIKVSGDVEDFNFQPGTRVYVGEEGDVSYLVPDATVLNADFQIQALENKMEEMAGAPRQAMGIRTPGEKTAFEVQSLQNAAGRIFQHKAAKFEKEFIEPILYSMLESARRNLNDSDIIRMYDDTTGATFFRTVTRDVLTAQGTIIPIGARHFSERANRVQNINQLIQLKQDPSIGVHLSGKEIARLLAEELGEDKLFGENIGIKEQSETQSKAQDAEASNMERLQTAAETGL